jgi:hydrogenase assembly chaperone HypC/HupF
MAAPTGPIGSTPMTHGPAARSGESREWEHERRFASDLAREPGLAGLSVCISFPGRVTSIDGADAIVEIDGRVRRASLRMRTDVTVGDWVLVGAGSVLRRLDEREAAEINQLLKPAMHSGGIP